MHLPRKTETYFQCKNRNHRVIFAGRILPGKFTERIWSRPRNSVYRVCGSSWSVLDLWCGQIFS